jgi:hypothetical protein
MRKPLIAILVLVFLVFITDTSYCFMPIAKAQLSGDTLIKEGVGIREIRVGQSNKSDVVAAYGKNFMLIKHNKYSKEIRYEHLGLSFFYCYNDRKKKIFSIGIKKPYQGKTSKGFLIGDSTLEDVIRLYGKAEEVTTDMFDAWNYRYSGVRFQIEFVPLKEINGMSDPRLKKKIIEISIYDPKQSFNPCDGV